MSRSSSTSIATSTCPIPRRRPRSGARSRPRRVPATSSACGATSGAGKTHLAKAFGAGLGVTDTITSPSFILMAEYEGRLPLFHVDLYRLADGADAPRRRPARRPPDGGRDARRVARPAGRRSRRSAARRRHRRDRRRAADDRADRASGRRRTCAATSRRLVTRRRRPARPSWRSTPRRPRSWSSRSAPPTGEIRRRHDWPAGYRHGETLLPAIGRSSASRASRRSRTRRGSSSGPGRARSPGCASASPPRRGSPTASACRSSAISTGAALLAAAADAERPTRPACSSLPAGRRSDRSVRDGRAAPSCCRASEPTLGRRRAGSSRSTSPIAPRPTRSRAARRPAPGSARRCSRIGAELARPPGDVDDLADLVPEYVTLPRGVARDGRGGRMVARPPGEGPHRADAARGPRLRSTPSSAPASDAPWPPDAYRSELETNRLAPVPRRPRRRRDRRRTAGCG